MDRIHEMRLCSRAVGLSHLEELVQSRSKAVPIYVLDSRDFCAMLLLSRGLLSKLHVVVLSIHVQCDFLL